MSDKQARPVSDALQFNVAQFIQQPSGTRRDYDIEVELSNLDEGLSLRAPLQGWVRLLRAGQGILVTGDLETVVGLFCTRCLSEFEMRVSIEIEEEYRPTIDLTNGARLEQDFDHDAANWIDDHHILDLTEVVRQNFWLALPASALCRSDCRGFCPVCGQDRNAVPCRCSDDSIDPRWVALTANTALSE